VYDIAIIGLGPGGATLARLLDPSFKVIAIDKKNETKESFHKPCGGLLAPDAQKALSRFNLTLPKDVLVDPQIFAVKTIDLKRNLLRYYQRFYINLDRRKFDNWLISLIPENVEIVKNSVCTGIKKIEEGYEITCAENGVVHKVSSRFVVGADGSNSVVRKALFPKKKIKRYLSIQQRFPERNNKPFYSSIFDKGITDSYCWTISKDNVFILGGAFPVKGAKSKFECLKARLAERGIETGVPIKTEACMVSMPRRLRDFYTGRNGAFLIGEAAGFISPSSLEGISYALDSAFILAKAINSRRKHLNRKYKAATLRIRLKLLAKCLKRPFMYRPVLRKIIMKSGIKTIKVIESET